MKHSRLKVLILIVALSLSLALTPMLAQETTEAAPTTSEAVPVTTATDCWLPILLMGVAAVLALGAREWWREGGARYFGGKESTA
jgi:hypothetical protein